MGVHGLWKLIEASGKPIPIETLENAVLSVDVSIWLHQLVKGFQESTGGRSVANPHLLGLFHRICKLLFFRIKPVFVFDGGVPALKKKTIAARRNVRSKANESIEKARRDLLENIIKQQALGQALGENVSLPRKAMSKVDTMFALPDLPSSSKHQDEGEESSSDSEFEEPSKQFGDLYSIDLSSEKFTTLPADMRHDILTDLLETRKQNSWAKVHLMPENADDFSSFQMNQLLKRRMVQQSLEDCRKEMGATRGYTVAELEMILREQGVDTTITEHRIASDASKTYLYASKGGTSTINSSQSSTFDSQEGELSQSNSRPSPVQEYFEPSDESSSSEATEEELTQEEILNIIKLETNHQSGSCQDQCSNADQEVVQFKKDEAEEQLTMGASKKNVNDRVDHVKEKILVQNNELKRKIDRESFPGNAKDLAIKSSSSSSDEEVVVNPKRNKTTLEESLKIVSSEDVMTPKASVVPQNSSEVSPSAQHPTKSIDLGHDASSALSTVNNTSNTRIEPVINSLAKESPSPKPENGSEEKPFEPSKPSASPDPQNQVHEMSSSDTDSSDLEDVPENTEMEIVINPNESIEEDDIFADVFSSDNKVSNSNSKENIPEDSKSNPEPQVTTASNLDEKGSTAPVEETASQSETSVVNSQTSTGSDENSSKILFSKLMSTTQLRQLKSSLERETVGLCEERIRNERLASTISEQLTLEAQELLRLFGIPFVVAPMEAEAQCAFLDLTGQTHGTITDDSDIWLFGGRSVYKNFFDQKKVVLQFKSSDIERCFKLSREDMVLLALLVGSDYTQGLDGVGPVTAMEILAKYSHSSEPMDRLIKFAVEHRTASISGSLARKLFKIRLPDGFPNKEVFKAYIAPAVDESKDEFTWAEPDVENICEFTRQKFGWDETKTNSILQPVLDKFHQRKTQKTLHSFFDWAFDDLEKKVSKRVEKAVTKMGQPDESPEKVKKPRKRPADPTSEADRSSQAASFKAKADQILKECQMRIKLSEEEGKPRKSKTSKPSSSGGVTFDTAVAGPSGLLVKPHGQDESLVQEMLRIERQWMAENADKSAPKSMHIRERAARMLKANKVNRKIKLDRSWRRPSRMPSIDSILHGRPSSPPASDDPTPEPEPEPTSQPRSRYTAQEAARAKAAKILLEETFIKNKKKPPK